LTTDFRDILGDPHVDSVVIATPVSSHFDIATRALQAGKHVFRRLQRGKPTGIVGVAVL